MRSRLGRTALARFGACAALLVIAAAQARAAGDETFLPLVVNSRPAATALAVVRTDDILVRSSDLADAGFHVTGRHETIDGADFTSLRSLGSGLSYHLDPIKLQLVIDAPASFFGSNDVDLAVKPPADLRYGSQRGGYLNYAFSEINGSFNTFEETALSNGHATFYASASSGVSGLTRDLTSLVYDDRAALRQTTIGDAQVFGSDFSGGEFVGGVTVARDTSLNPYAVVHPMAGLSGTTSRPATALIYSNGVLVKTIDLAAGAFDLNNLPLPSGAANVTVVLRDALGNTTTINRNLYVSSTLLTKGFTDYSYSLGFLRDDASSERYGPGVAVGRYRLGVTNALTAGGELESGGGISSGGPNLTLGLAAGQLSLAGAASSERGHDGSAALAAYSYSGRAIGVQAGILEQSAHFARLTLDESADRLLHDASIAVTGHFAHRLSLGFTVDRSAYRDSGLNNSTSLNAGMPLGESSLLITATDALVTAVRPQRTKTVYASVFFSRPGRNTTAQISEQGGTAGATTTVAVQKPANAGVGFGYLASVSQGAQPGSDVALDERAPFATASFDRAASNAAAFTSVSLSGSLASLGTGVLFGRPIDGAFAVVQTPSVSGLPVYLGGELQGTTDRNGRLLIPELAPNFENSVNIDPRSLPPDVELAQTKELIAPFERTGLLVVYGTHQVRAITGTVRIRRNGVATAPELTPMTIVLPGGPVTQGLGGDGTFYFENIPAGRFKAHVVDGNGGCDFTIEVPSSPSSAVSNLGSLTCEASRPRP